MHEQDACNDLQWFSFANLPLSITPLQGHHRWIPGRLQFQRGDLLKVYGRAESSLTYAVALAHTVNNEC